MKNIAKLGLTALACFVLSACGGSGGGNNASAPSDSRSQTAVNPSTPIQTSQQATATQAENRTGGAIVVSGEDERVTITRKAITHSDDFKYKIVLDGKDITIGFPGILSGSWAHLGSLHTCCGRYTDVRFGLVESANQNDDDILFYNGSPTQSMPTSGSATYNGHFIMDAVDDIYPYFDEKDFVTGTATFNADFGNKTLSGTLSEPALQPISVNAAINGNSFTGTAKSGSFRTTADVEGKFYGTNAKELGGAFFDSQKTWGGAFGASQ